MAPNPTHVKMPCDKSPNKKDVVFPPFGKEESGDLEKSGVANEPLQQAKNVSPSKLRQFQVIKPRMAGRKGCAVQPSVKHAVVMVKDILKPELGKALDHAEAGEEAAPEANPVLATPKVRANLCQNTTARELYGALKRWQGVPGQAAIIAVEDDFLGDPVIIKEGTEPLGANPALDLAYQSPMEGSSPLSSPSKLAAVSREPCTPRCPRATGEMPELQCKRCLCFFHPICIGLTRSHPATARRRFICKACTKLPYKSAGKSTNVKKTTPSERALVTCKPKQDVKGTARDPSLFQSGPGSVSSTLVPAVTPISTCSSSAVPSSSSAAPLTLIRPSYSVASTISVPIVHLVANGGAPKRPPFASNPVVPAAVRAMPGPLTTGVLRPGRIPHLGGGRHLMPPLLPAPPSVAALAATTAKAPKISSLRIQSMGGQDVTVCPSAYYTIHLAQKPGSISDAALKSIVSQLVQNHPEELQKRAGQSIILQAQPAVLPPSAQPVQLVQQAARSLLQPAAVKHVAASALQPAPPAVPEKQNVGAQHCPLASMVQVVAGSGDSATTQLLAASTAAETSSSIVTKVEPGTELPVGTQQFPANAMPAAVGSCDRGSDAPVVSSVPVVPSSDTTLRISSVTKVSSASQQEMPRATVCRALVPAQEFESGAVPLTVCDQQTALLDKTQCASTQLLTSSTRAETSPQVMPKVEPDTEPVPSADETLSIHVMHEEETGVTGAQSSLYMGSSGCQPVTSAESTLQAFTVKDKSHALRSVSPLPGCPFVISSSYSLAGEAISESQDSSPAECDGKEEAPRTNMDQAYVVVTKDRHSADGSDTSDVRLAYEIERIWPAASHGGNVGEVPSSEDVSALRVSAPCISGNTVVSATSTQPTHVEQRDPRDKVPASHAACSHSGVQCVCRVSRIRSKRRQHLVTLPESSGVSLWLRSDGRLTCVRDRLSVETNDCVFGSVEPVNCVSDTASSMRDFTVVFTVLTEIFKWLPTPTLCKTAQVSRAWRKLSAMSDSWKRVNFSKFHVHDWDACVKMLRNVRTEALVLDRDSLEPVLCRITMLDTVEHVTLEVNPLQLARVARAFPHLHSISAFISRRGRTAEPQHPASLGGLSELMCVAGLERLELRGAHGLAILPLSMTPICLAQRCRQLRALSLVTVQNMTPEVVFLISLLKGLEELHLGECVKWSETSFLNISKLKQLRRLTLEHGEDKSGFRSMLLRLTNLERLELKQWTLHNSLADTLPRMTLLRHLLLCPVNGDLASKTNRNVLRSCLAAGANLKQITWVMSSKASTSSQAVFDINLAFEPGNLCECPSIFTASNSADVPVSASGDSPKNANVSPKAQEIVSAHLQCCVFAKKFRHMWKPSLHIVWYMTVRQVCKALKCCLGPRTAVCFCVQVEQ